MLLVSDTKGGRLSSGVEGTAAIFGAAAVTAWLCSLEGYGQFGSARGHGCALHAGNYSPAPFECPAPLLGHAFPTPPLPLNLCGPSWHARLAFSWLLTLRSQDCVPDAHQESLSGTTEAVVPILHLPDRLRLGLLVTGSASPPHLLGHPAPGTCWHQPHLQPPAFWGAP